MSAHQEIEQQYYGQECAHDGGEAKAGDDGEAAGLRQQTANVVERGLGDLVGVERLSEQVNGRLADRLAGQPFEHARQIRGDIPRFDHEALACKIQEHCGDAEDDQERRDRKQQPRPARAFGQPIKRRRADIGDDGGEQERQQDRFDEIEKDGDGARGKYDRTRLPGIERLCGAGARGARLLASGPRGFHE